MTEISQEDAVNWFSQLTKPFFSSNTDPRLLIEVIIKFYRDVRIAELSVGTDGDMLLLQWGITKPFLISDFADFRHLSNGEVNFDYREFQYINLTRQIFAFENEETEFDDEAIGLCVDLIFFEKSGDEPSSNLRVTSPSELDDITKEFLQNSFVKKLVDSKPSLVNAYVTNVG